MKNLIAIISVLTIVLSSCTSSKNGLVLKRKYNKGYYIAGNYKKSDVSKQQNTSEIKEKVEDTKAIASIDILPSVNEALPLVTEDYEIKTTAILTEKRTKEIKHNTILVDTKNITASVKDLKINKVHQQINTDKTLRSTSISVGTQLLLIIFCFFPIFSLIAMYVHDNHSFTLNFWVNLLLYLTVIGWIIFGLLVVLDIINLA